MFCVYLFDTQAYTGFMLVPKQNTMDMHISRVCKSVVYTLDGALCFVLNFFSFLRKGEWNSGDAQRRFSYSLPSLYIFNIHLDQSKFTFIHAYTSLHAPPRTVQLFVNAIFYLHSRLI